jgi:hypothetical protein
VERLFATLALNTTAGKTLITLQAMGQCMLDAKWLVKLSSPSWSTQRT